MVTQLAAATWIRRWTERIGEQKQFLTDLDAAIGDADHGINMDRGLREVMVKLPAATAPELAPLFKMVGMTLLSKVGGSSGPLYGTFFLKLAEAAGQHTALTGAELVTVLASGVTGIGKRGNSVPGEKTMLDALVPALAALQSAVERGEDLCLALGAATAAADQRPRQLSRGPLDRSSRSGRHLVSLPDRGAEGGPLPRLTRLASVHPAPCPSSCIPTAPQ
jgi:dihydroxyacetone kinase-like protein